MCHSWAHSRWFTTMRYTNRHLLYYFTSAIWPKLYDQKSLKIRSFRMRCVAAPQRNATHPMWTNLECSVDHVYVPTSKAMPTERRNSLAGRRSSRTSSKWWSAIATRLGRYLRLCHTDVVRYSGLAISASARRYIYTSVHRFTRSRNVQRRMCRDHLLTAPAELNPAYINTELEDKCFWCLRGRPQGVWTAKISWH